jgi:mRNA-degrading endonuclease RelE of RelBE toxin-antitoxin system
MQYEVILTDEAKEDFKRLESHLQDKLVEDFKVIQVIDIAAVKVNSLGDKLFEIKTDKLRSLFEYRKGQIIVVAVIFIKKGQKAPKIYTDRARKILRDW